MSTPSSEQDVQKESGAQKRNGFVEWSKTPFAFLIGAALVLAVLVVFFLGVLQDHESSLKHCVDAGGSFDRAYGNCDMSGEESPR